jgi:DNA primase catalytic core
MFEQIIQSCRFLLENFPEARSCQEYLDTRISKESQELFQFGYFPDSNNLSALSSLIDENILKEEKLIYSKNIEDCLFPRKANFGYFDKHPLIMIYRDAYGKIIALIGRSLLSEEERRLQKIPKYKNTVFLKGHHVFGLYENKASIIENDCVYVVEGQIDVIKAMERGIKNIVALGNSYMTPYQFSVITRYTNNIVLLLDNDEAGLKGRSRIVDKYGKLANITHLYIPESYKDIDEYLSKNDVEGQDCLRYFGK